MSIPKSDKPNPLMQLSEQALAIVRQKISRESSINLCLEDASDWVNAKTRHVVLEVRLSIIHATCHRCTVIVYNYTVSFSCYTAKCAAAKRCQQPTPPPRHRSPQCGGVLHYVQCEGELLWSLRWC